MKILLSFQEDDGESGVYTEMTGIRPLSLTDKDILNKYCKPMVVALKNKLIEKKPMVKAIHG